MATRRNPRAIVLIFAKAFFTGTIYDEVPSTCDNAQAQIRHKTEDGEQGHDQGEHGQQRLRAPVERPGRPDGRGH